MDPDTDTDDLTEVLALPRVDDERLTSLDADAALVGLQRAERVVARLHALQADLLVAVASPEPRIDEYLVLDPRPDHDEERLVRIADAVREEVAAALRMPAATAQGLIDQARLLHGPLAQTRQLLRRGDITRRHVAVIAEAAERLPGGPGGTDQERRAFAAACQRLEESVLRTAARGTVSRTRAAAQRALLRIDAEGAARRRGSARCTRDVYVVDEPDGISCLIARLATEQAHAVLAAVEGEAGRGDPSDARRAGERRADALTALVLAERRGAGGAFPRVHLDLTVPFDILLGIGDEPMTLGGRVPLAIDVLHELLADDDVEMLLRCLVTDPSTGHLLDLGRRSYRVPDRLRAFIVARDRTCRFPGCTRRADRCQIDHADAWDDGGATDAANVGAPCVRHHQLKTHGNWQVRNSATDGSCTWISPMGRRYDHDPPDY